MSPGSSGSAARAPMIEMFSGPGCAYCAQTRTLLEARGLDFVDYDTADPKHREEFTRRLPRARSIPQIFIGGKHIGSWEDLQILDGDGRLAEMTAAADG